MDSKGFHHYYIGILMLIISFIILISIGSPTLSATLFWLGLIVIADDYFQHWRQKTDPYYRSPINMLYGATLYKVAFIRSVNAWFDRLFGRNN